MNTSDAIYELYSANANRVVLPESPDRVLTILDEAGNEMGTVHKTELGTLEDAAEALFMLSGYGGIEEIRCVKLLLKSTILFKALRVLQNKQKEKP